MLHSDFRFIDLAIGGVRNRNQVVDLCEIQADAVAADSFTTMFRFRNDYKKHVDSTNSVRGADQFSCWSDFVWFDIDASSLSDATISMQNLLRGLATMDLLEHTHVFFSGSKGYHIGVESVLFGLEPSSQLPTIMRQICEQMASLFSVDIDAKIYNHNRLWRLVDTLHGKSEYYKTKLPLELARTGELNDILVYVKAERERKPHFCLGRIDLKPLSRLQQFATDATKGHVEKTSQLNAFELSPFQHKVVVRALDLLLAQGVMSGQRDNEALLRASECRKVNIPREGCTELLLEWNKSNSPPLSDSAIDRVVTSAYTGNGYDFGTNSPSLYAARMAAKREVLTSDAVQQFETKKSGERADEPRSFTDWMSSIDIHEQLDIVGKLISWRGRISLLSGREKTSGKSTLCTYEAVCALKRGYRVYWASPDESLGDILVRFKPYIDNNESLGDDLFIAGNASVPRTWSDLVNDVIAFEPDLIVLDSVHSLLQRLIGDLPDSSETHAWHRWMSHLRPLAVHLDTAIVWIHHASKHNDKAIGSVGITAAVDETIAVRPDANSRNSRRLSYMGRRTNASMDCTVRYEGPPVGFIRLTDAMGTQQQSTKLEDDINQKTTQGKVEWALLEHFRINPNVWIRQTPDLLEIARLHTTPASAPRTLGNALQRLQARGIADCQLEYRDVEPHPAKEWRNTAKVVSNNKPTDLIDKKEEDDDE
jgi:hypothetical protein